MFSENHVPQGIKSPNLRSPVFPQEFSQSRTRKSQISRVSFKTFSENHLPKSQISKGVSLRFFSKGPQISNRKGRPRKIVQRIISSNLKSQGASPLRFFSESSHQISNLKGCPPKIFQRIILPVFVSFSYSSLFRRATASQYHFIQIQVRLHMWGPLNKALASVRSQASPDVYGGWASRVMISTRAKNLFL